MTFERTIADGQRDVDQWLNFKVYQKYGVITRPDLPLELPYPLQGKDDSMLSTFDATDRLRKQADQLILDHRKRMDEQASALSHGHYWVSMNGHVTVAAYEGFSCFYLIGREGPIHPGQLDAIGEAIPGTDWKPFVEAA